MARDSCITHSPKQLMVIVRQDYYLLLEKDTTAAALLGIFEYWANAEAARAPEVVNPCVGNRSIKEFEELLLGIATDKQIRTRLQTLKNKGYIEIQEEKKKGSIKSFSYKFMVSSVQADLDALNWQEAKEARRSNNRGHVGQITDELRRSNNRGHVGQITEARRSNNRGHVGQITEQPYIEKKEEFKEEEREETPPLFETENLAEELTLVNEVSSKSNSSQTLLPVHKEEPVNSTTNEITLEGKGSAASPEVVTSLFAEYFFNLVQKEGLVKTDLMSRSKKFEEDMRWNRFVFPWRTKTWGGVYGYYHSGFVDDLALGWAKKQKREEFLGEYITASTRSISKLENTVEGIETLLRDWTGYQGKLAEKEAIAINRAEMGIIDTPQSFADSSEYMRLIGERMKASASSPPPVTTALDNDEGHQKAKEAVEALKAEKNVKKPKFSSISDIIAPTIDDFTYTKELMGQQLNSSDESLRNEAFAWAKEKGFRVVRDRTTRMLTFIEIEMEF